MGRGWFFSPAVIPGSTPAWPSFRTLTAMHMSEAAPWWGVPLIAGVFTIIGVAAAQFVAWTLDRRKADREREQRWLNDRRSVYAAYSAAVQAFFRAARLHWQDGMGQADIDRYVDNANLHRQEIQLIGSREVAEAAQEMFLVGVMRVSETLERPARTEEERTELWLALRGKRENFIAAARRELQIDH
jgi:hypothetical protein